MGVEQVPGGGGRVCVFPPRRAFDAHRRAQLLILAAALFFLLPLHRLVAPLPRCNFGLAAVGAPVLDIDDLLARPELPEVAVEQETEQDGKGHGEGQRPKQPDRKSTRLNSSHYCAYRMPSSA